MNALDLDVLALFVNAHIHEFHTRRLRKLENQDLKTLLRRKNPYLFRAKNVLTASQLVNGMLMAVLSSSEEEMFGEFLETIAFYVAETCLGASTSTGEGMDFEFKADGILNIVSIKSGQNWGNSSQQQKIKENFRRAVVVQKQKWNIAFVQPILGICYGRAKDMDNGTYIRKVGQSFWYFISGDPELYVKIIEPIGYRAREHNEAYEAGKAALENKLMFEFIADFCYADGSNDWQKLVQFNSQNLI
jgi:hypothetical protein